MLVPDRAAIAADGDDLSFVTVRVEDKDGNFCPTADNLVKFALDGPGENRGRRQRQRRHRRALPGGLSQSVQRPRAADCPKRAR